MEQLEHIERYLESLYEDKHYLHEAMRYSLLAGGKRFRPMLVLCCGQDVALPLDSVMPIAAAIEMIHTYSLIHDDLPALDNDDLRRGKPTNHRVFGEATAILAGDGLLTDAFLEITKANVNSDICVEMIQYLVQCIGSEGMIQGQSDDLQHEQKRASLKKSDAYQTLKMIHENKTGKLIEACFVLPALAAKLDADTLQAIQKVSRQIGLWFQIRDDILDVSETTEVLGKDAGSDLLNDKLTYVSLFGLEEAQNKLKASEAEIHRLFTEQLQMMPVTYNYIKQVMI